MITGSHHPSDVIRGLEISHKWIDESGDINQHMYDAVMYGTRAYKIGSTIDFATVKPSRIPCSFCGAEAGRGCRVMGPRDEAAFGGYHITRDHDAKLATEAVRAMRCR